METMEHLDDDVLTKQAKERNPRVKRWFGRRGGGGSRRCYVCYLCDEVIDTESAKYGMTKHAEEAIVEHSEMHKAG